MRGWHRHNRAAAAAAETGAQGNDGCRQRMQCSRMIPIKNRIWFAHIVFASFLMISDIAHSAAVRVQTTPIIDTIENIVGMQSMSAGYHIVCFGEPALTTPKNI